MPVADDPALAKHAAERRRLWRDAALWSRGFRPFFLFAGFWALAAMVIWPPFFTGEIEIPTAFSPVDWHVHEMIFGYGAAVVAGFLLTAIPNWTGRLPVAGPPLMLLCGLWALGRVAVLTSATLGAVPATALDASFLLAFAGVTAREVIAGRNLRNVKVVALVLGARDREYGVPRRSRADRHRVPCEPGGPCGARAPHPVDRRARRAELHA